MSMQLQWSAKGKLQFRTRYDHGTNTPLGQSLEWSCWSDVPHESDVATQDRSDSNAADAHSGLSDLRAEILRAVTSCPHAIESEAVELRHDHNVPGNNALSQLVDRLVRVFDADVDDAIRRYPSPGEAQHTTMEAEPALQEPITAEVAQDILRIRKWIAEVPEIGTRGAVTMMRLAQTCADRVATLESEMQKLRKALHYYTNSLTHRLTDNGEVARAALGEQRN